VLDLMIHDLDIVLSLVNQSVVEVSAFGCTAVGPHEDFAQARVLFADGCVANLTANRVSERPERTMTVHADGAVTRHRPWRFRAQGHAAQRFARSRRV
jgi:predicted dehydrogenase